MQNDWINTSMPIIFPKYKKYLYFLTLLQGRPPTSVLQIYVPQNEEGISRWFARLKDFAIATLWYKDIGCLKEMCDSLKTITGKNTENLVTRISFFPLNHQDSRTKNKSLLTAINEVTRATHCCNLTAKNNS